MTKTIAAVALTLVGLYLVLTFKTSPVTRTVTSAAPAPTAAVSAAPPTPNPVRTVDGPLINMRWGPVQVAVTVDGSRITNVNALELPMDHARSVYISQTVAPMLRSEVLQTQSANINVISGATYTTEAYAQSLQAALDSARV